MYKHTHDKATIICQELLPYTYRIDMIGAQVFKRRQKSDNKSLISIQMKFHTHLFSIVVVYTHRIANIKPGLIKRSLFKSLRVLRVPKLRDVGKWCVWGGNTN